MPARFPAAVTYTNPSGRCLSLSRALNHSAVLDGEVVLLDGDGRPRFYDLLRRRGQPVFYAFDCLSLNGRDLRARPLLDRKRILERLVRVGRESSTSNTSMDSKALRCSS